MIIFIVLMMFGVISLSFFLTGLIMHDLQEIKRELLYKKHPHARIWKKRPLISVNTEALSEETIKKLKRTYRKFEFITDNKLPHGEYFLVIADRCIIEKDAFNATLRYMNASNRRIIAITPTITTPTSLRQFLANYRLLLASSFMKSRLGLCLTPSDSLFPALVRRDVVQRPRSQIVIDRCYRIAEIALASCIPISATYFFFVAYTAMQPVPLIMSLVGFSTLVVTAIWSYDHISLKQKLAYILLLPSTYGYFFVLAWIRPLKMLANVTKAEVPFSISLFMRVKDILRIVK